MLNNLDLFSEGRLIIVRELNEILNPEMDKSQQRCPKDISKIKMTYLATLFEERNSTDVWRYLFPHKRTTPTV